MNSFLSKADRLILIYERLADAPPPEDLADALATIQRVFREVEDMYSGVPDEPDNQDRMYPPVEEMEEEMPGLPNASRYRHKRHYTVISANGAFEIRRFVYSTGGGKKIRTGEETVFSKNGADGRGVAN